MLAGLKPIKGMKSPTFLVDVQTFSQHSMTVKFLHGESGGFYSMFVQSNNIVMKGVNIY